MKKPAKPSAHQTLDKLLRLLFQLRANPKARFADLRMSCPEADSVNRILNREKRYEWKQIGVALHLMTVHEKPSQSVAFIVKEEGKWRGHYSSKFNRGVELVERSSAKLKGMIDAHFDLMHDSDE